MQSFTQPIETTDCGSCCAITHARPPNRAFWALIIAFWMASVSLGFAGAQGPGWAIVVGASWVALATSVALFARRAATWTCVECGSTVVPPRNASRPITGSLGAATAGHA